MTRQVAHAAPGHQRGASVRAGAVDGGGEQAGAVPASGRVWVHCQLDDLRAVLALEVGVVARGEQDEPDHRVAFEGGQDRRDRECVSPALLELGLGELRRRDRQDLGVLATPRGQRHGGEPSGISAPGGPHGGIRARHGGHR